MGRLLCLLLLLLGTSLGATAGEKGTSVCEAVKSDAARKKVRPRPPHAAATDGFVPHPAPAHASALLQLLLRYANPFFGEHTRQKPEGPKDLAVLSVLYSPGRFVRPVLNLLLVQNRLAALGIPLFTLEVALGEDAHVLQPGARTRLLRSSSCLFQKERLMNVLEASVPAAFTKVVFLDGDVLLANSQQGGAHWYDVLSELLDSHDVVQPFDLSGHLDLSFKRVSRVKCSVLHAHRNASLDGQIPQQGLHTGLAWAFRRDWLQAQGGLFDVAIHGGGDSINAGALGQFPVCLPQPDGASDTACLAGAGRILVPAYVQQFQAYAAKVAAHPPRSAFAPTLVALDLWHGSHKHRQYTKRLEHFTDVGDVGELVRTDGQGIYEFREGAAAALMNSTICRYFRERKDDALTDNDPKMRPQ